MNTTAEYPLIPMSEIRDEPRKIAIAWHENATNWIGDKHKLASDIQNYTDWHTKELEEVLRYARNYIQVAEEGQSTIGGKEVLTMINQFLK